MIYCEFNWIFLKYINISILYVSFILYRYYDIFFFIKWKEKEKEIQQGFYNDVQKLSSRFF